MATPRPPQKFEEVKSIARQNRQRQKRQRAKARKGENNKRIDQIKNKAAHLVLPPKPAQLPDTQIVHISASSSLTGQDIRVSSTSGEPQAYPIQLSG